jgi:hypothetical protein
MIPKKDESHIVANELPHIQLTLMNSNRGLFLVISTNNAIF